MSKFAAFLFVILAFEMAVAPKVGFKEFVSRFWKSKSSKSTDKDQESASLASTEAGSGSVASTAGRVHGAEFFHGPGSGSGKSPADHDHDFSDLNMSAKRREKELRLLQKDDDRHFVGDPIVGPKTSVPTAEGFISKNGSGSASNMMNAEPNLESDYSNMARTGEKHQEASDHRSAGPKTRRSNLAPKSAEMESDYARLDKLWKWQFERERAAENPVPASGSAVKVGSGSRAAAGSGSGTHGHLWNNDDWFGNAFSESNFGYQWNTDKPRAEAPPSGFASHLSRLSHNFSFISQPRFKEADLTEEKLPTLNLDPRVTPEHLAKLHVIRGNIVKQDVLMIVNAANNRLVKGGGVDDAIHRACLPDMRALVSELDEKRAILLAELYQKSAKNAEELDEITELEQKGASLADELDQTDANKVVAESSSNKLADPDDQKLVAEMQKKSKTSKGRRRGGYVLPDGTVVVTKAYGKLHTNMGVEYIAHAVGPSVGHQPTPKERHDLQSCYQGALDQLLQLDTHGRSKTIAFPCISVGVFCYPPIEAAVASLEAMLNWLATTPNSEQIEQIRVITFEEHNDIIYRNLVAKTKKQFGNSDEIQTDDDFDPRKSDEKVPNLK